MIKRYLFLLLSLVAMTVYGQNAKAVLDATAKKLTAGGTYANFVADMDNSKLWGNIAIRGDMFKITSAEAITWYDGKTQWTYMRGTDEVSITNPDDDQQQQINPYHFINLYKKGYQSSVAKKGGKFVVTLKRTSGSSDITDAVIDIDAKTYYPLFIKVKTSGKWTSFKISGAKKVNYNTSHFRFPKKSYKTAEIIDLR